MKGQPHATKDIDTCDASPEEKQQAQRQKNRTKAKISITKGENRLGLSEYMDEETIDLMFGCAQCYEHERVEERKREIERFEEEDEEENNEMKGGEDTSLEEQKKDGNRSEMSMQTLEDHFVEQNMVLSVHIEDVEVDSDGHKTLSI